MLQRLVLTSCANSELLRPTGGKNLLLKRVSFVLGTLHISALKTVSSQVFYFLLMYSNYSVCPLFRYLAEESAI